MSAAREINITPSCKNEFHALPPAHFKQVWEKIDFLVENPIPDGKQKKKLEAKKDLYRLRVGDFRVFYTFGPTWVRLLGVRRKNERTYGHRIDTLAANEPEFTSNDEDDGLDQLLEGRDGSQVPFRISVDPQPNPLPRPITIEWLRQLKVPVGAFPALMACQTEQALLSAPVSAEVLELVLDSLFPRPIEVVAQQPDFIVKEANDLVRYRNGDLVAFLLKLDEDQVRLTDWAMTGPTMVKGGAGTGKSTVALHRVKRLLERPGSTGSERVLFTTYTRALVTASQQLLAQMLEPEQLRRVRVATCDELTREIVASVRRIGSFDAQGGDLAALQSARATFEVPGKTVFERRLRARALEAMPDRYLLEEFDWIIDGRELKTVGAYLQAPRPGRGIALRDGAREAVWGLHTAFLAEIRKRKVERFAALRSEAREIVSDGRWKQHFDYVLVDETQDLTPAALALVADVAKTATGLFFAADGRQSLYSRNYTWNAVHPRLQFTGRTAVLRRNYRSTEEIVRAASEVLGEVTPEDGPGPQGGIHGPVPILLKDVSPEKESEWVARFIRQMASHLRMKVSSAAVLVPSNEVGAAVAEELRLAGLQATFFRGRELDLKADVVKVMTLYSAKGLEFPVVAIAGFRAGTSRTRESFGDDDAYGEWLGNQRKVLYVGMTRAMRGLMVSVPSGCEHEALCVLSGDSWALEAGA